VADDFTGAADAAGRFAALGLSVTITTDTQRIPDVDVVAISSGGRDLPEEEAIERTCVVLEAILRSAGDDSRLWIYKKIDSTLRGHPGAELAATMNALGATRALVAPAFPAQGRTTVDGHQLVHGRPLEDTAFGSPSTGGNLCQLVQRHVHPHRVWHIRLQTVRAGPDAIGAMMTPGRGVFVADAACDDDLDALVRAAIEQRIHLLCGSAGLARALATVARLPPLATPPKWPPTKAGPILVVAGSLHPATARQIESAKDRGAAVVRLAEQHGDGAAHLQSSALDAAMHHLARGADVVLTTAGDRLSDIDHRYSESLATTAGRLADQTDLGGLVLTGGDTAVATLLAVGSSRLSLLGEVDTGIPWGRLWNGRLRGLPVVTKAGGFGAASALTRCIDHLRGAALGHAQEPARPVGPARPERRTVRELRRHVSDQTHIKEKPWESE